MGENIYQDRIAYRILNRVGKEFRSTKASLQMIRCLTVELVSQQLEASELDMAEEAEETWITGLDISNSRNISSNHVFPPTTIINQ